MPPELSDTTRTQIESELFAGRKIQAIKLLRGATGLGLKEAKDMAEAMEAELRNHSPEKFTVPAKAGCMSVLLLTTGASLAMLASFLRH